MTRPLRSPIEARAGRRVAPVPSFWPRRETDDGRWYHGGVPGLDVGDMLEPGHTRPAAPEAPPSTIVVVTGIQEAARWRAAHYFPKPYEPGGDMYEVEPNGELSPYPCDEPDRWGCISASVVRVIARGVTPRRHDGERPESPMTRV